MARTTRVSLLSVIAVLLLATDLSGQPQERHGDRLEFRGYEVYRVRLARPFTVTESQGEKKTYNKAYVVRFTISRPPFWGEKVDFFVGDFRVPEYGGWAEGIYFKVYDPARIPALRGGEIRYRVGDGEVISTGRRFDVDIQAIQEVSEAELFPRSTHKDAQR